MKLFSKYLFPLLALLFPLQTFACDFCSLYLASQTASGSAKGFYTGVSEQFTRFGTLQMDGQVVANPIGQYMNSSITQFYFAYGINDHIGIQLNLPLIHRSFRRPFNGAIQDGSVTGIGDMSLLAKVMPYRKIGDRFSFYWKILGGVKFPTGSSYYLQEEANEVNEAGEMAEGGMEGMSGLRAHHTGHSHESDDENALPASGIHGHDLALGSGSFDAIFGTSLYTRYRRFFATADVQGFLRTPGSYGYRYANEVQWSAGPGAYLVLRDTQTLALQAKLGGEYKGLDTLGSATMTDTGMTSVYVGPSLQYTWRNYVSSEVGADFPLLLNNTNLQIVPDYRVRGAITGHF